MDTKAMSLFLKELRKERGLTQEQAAEALFVSSKTVSRWETGATIPDLETLVKLAEFYQVDVKELIDGKRFGPEEDAESRGKNTLRAAAEYGRHTEMRAVLRTVLTMLAVILVIAGVCAIFAWRENQKRLDRHGTEYFYGKVTAYSRKEDNGSYELLLETDFDKVRIRVTAETMIASDELKARLDAQEKDVFLSVLSEYAERDRYEAERKGIPFVYPAFHIGNWRAG